MVIIKQILMGL